MTTTRSVAELQPEVDVVQATRHLRELHAGAEGWLSLLLLDSNKSRPPRYGFTEVQELANHGDFTESKTALQEACDARWNVYTACSVFGSVPEHGRGRETDVISVPGVWADLDVKVGSPQHFQTESQLLDFAALLPKPTLDVSTGSGGHHLYWLFHSDERLNRDDGQRMLHKWRAYLMKQADGLAVDDVHDTTRVLRVAGTTRWPKLEEAVQRPAHVILQDVGPRYPVANLELECHEAWQEYVQVRRARLAKEAERVALRRDQNAQFGSLLVQTYEQKIASTDWVDDDGRLRSTMTIYTRDQALTDILEVETVDGQFVCTKYTYAKIMMFGGDENELLREIKDSGVIE
jgi:hypothetical protein